MNRLEPCNEPLRKPPNWISQIVEQVSDLR